MARSTLKNAHLLLIQTIIMLTLISCASTSKQVQKETKNQNSLSDPARTYKIITQGIKTIFPQLITKLSNSSTLYSQKDTISIKMYISPTGSIDLIGFADKVAAGTGSILQNFMFKQVIDSTLKTETVTKVIIHSYKDVSGTAAISENMDISYIDIRPRDNILMLINFNKSVLGNAYSRRWADKPDLQGTVTVRFGIDEHGKVVFCKVVKTTMNDDVFEKKVCDIVKKWLFGEINNPGDIMEVVYPFKFYQE